MLQIMPDPDPQPWSRQVSAFILLRADVAHSLLAIRRFHLFIIHIVWDGWQLIDKIWQVAQCEDYQLPYYNTVPQDPSFEDMFQVITHVTTVPTYRT